MTRQIQPHRTMHFDGTGHVDCGVLNLPQADQTILATIKTTAISGYILASRDNGGGGLSMFVDGLGRLQAIVGNSVSSTSVNVNDGVQHILALVYDHAAGTLTHYVDGVSVSVDTSVGGTWTTGQKTFVGARNTAGSGTSLRFNGDLKDVRILPIAATAGQIADHYAAPTEHLLDTVLHLKGESVLDVAGGVDTVYDSSGNGNDGTTIDGVSTVETASYSFANEAGYSDGTTAEGIIVPRDESTRNATPMLDVLGNAIQYIGPFILGISSINDNQFFQRPENGELSIAVGGVSLFDELVEFQTDNGPWQTLATASGGAFSGSINVAAGNHLVRVRLATTPNVTTSVAIHVGDAFGWFGQDNSEGRFTNSQPYTGSLGFWIYDEENVWIPGAAGYASPGATGFSVLPRLASLIETSTSVPVAFVCKTASGTGITTGEWDSNPSGTQYLAAVDAMNASEINGLRAALFDAGEHDASSGTLTIASMQTALETLHQDIQLDTGIGFPLILSQTGATPFASSGGNLETVRLGQQAAVDSHSDIHFGVIGYDRANLHWATDVEAATYASRFAVAIDTALFGGALGTPPRLLSSVINGTRVILTYDRDLEAASNYSANAWTFEDQGTPIVVSAATKLNARTVVLTLAKAPLSTAIRATLGAGNSASGSDVPRGLVGQPALPGSAFVIQTGNAPAKEILRVKQVRRVMTIR